MVVMYGGLGRAVLERPETTETPTMLILLSFDLIQQHS